MADIEKIEAAIENHRVVAQQALDALRYGRESSIPDANGFKVQADMSGKSLAALWAARLDAAGLLDDFAYALAARGVVLDEDEPLPCEASHFDDKALGTFLARSQAFRCQILVDGQGQGSGILVGPSSVLTAWHVIAVAPPDAEQRPVDIEVKLANGRQITATRLYESRCGNEEYRNRSPKTDDDIVDRNDLALLSLREPVGLHFHFAALPQPPFQCRHKSALLLLHYPEGKWHGVTFGKFQRLRKLTGRWGHDINPTAPGSSGGGCFNTQFQLAGLHQGRISSQAGRLVPVDRFLDAIREHVAKDEIPDSVWSLDNTVTGELVVGREAFFHGYAAAARGPARVRGLWIQRSNLRDDVSGLPFTYRLLDRMVARSPSAQIVRISFDNIVHDFLEEIARRVTAAGLPIAKMGWADGVAPTQTEPEAAVSDRSRRLATAIDAAAGTAGTRLWLFFDHPQILFGDEHRWALTAFVDQALRLENLRLAMAGYEAIQLPGAKFGSGAEAGGEGKPGFYVEYLNGFTRYDVENLVRNAAKGTGETVSDERVKELVDKALAGLASVNGIYKPWTAAEVGRRLNSILSSPETAVSP
ncbi:MAG: trypsin-like peptidase domain-containing protein [Niveispirillum sp.]|nr:trypsin-like peptidase domain-containing protein [Niveispirillum sp.]